MHRRRITLPQQDREQVASRRAHGAFGPRLGRRRPWRRPARFYDGRSLSRL